MALDIVRQSVGGVPVVSVSGEIDISTAPELKRELDEVRTSSPGTIIVDLTDVGFLDSTGLGALIDARNASADHGTALPIVCDSERVLKLFTITGLDSVFDIHPTLDAAVQSVS